MKSVPYVYILIPIALAILCIISLALHNGSVNNDASDGTAEEKMIFPLSPIAVILVLAVGIALLFYLSKLKNCKIARREAVKKRKRKK